MRLAILTLGVVCACYLLLDVWPQIQKRYRQWRWRAVTRANLAQLRRQRQ